MGGEAQTKLHDEQPKLHSGHAPNELLRPKCLAAVLDLSRGVQMLPGWMMPPAKDWHPGRPMDPNHSTLPSVEGIALGGRRTQLAVANCSVRLVGSLVAAQAASRPFVAFLADRPLLLVGQMFQAVAQCRAWQGNCLNFAAKDVLPGPGQDLGRACAVSSAPSARQYPALSDHLPLGFGMRLSDCQKSSGYPNGFESSRNTNH